MTNARHSRAGLRALEAMASPARQELLSTLNEGPATVRALSAKTGRTRQALYHHIQILVTAGLVQPHRTTGEGRDAEQVYAVVKEKLVFRAIERSKRWIEALDRGAAALLRQTQRDFSAAVRDTSCRLDGPGRNIIAVRGKARLPSAELAKVNRHIDQVIAGLRSAKARTAGGRMYAVTLVLTPTREAVAPEAP